MTNDIKTEFSTAFGLYYAYRDKTCIGDSLGWGSTPAAAIENYNRLEKEKSEKRTYSHRNRIENSFQTEQSGQQAKIQKELK